MAEEGPNPEDTPLLLDAMLGKLATYLRMCGYDAAYALDRGVEADAKILELAESEGRLLVTRDAELARRADGRLLTSKDVADQLRELADSGFELELTEPSRCARCNGQLEPVADDEDRPEYAPSPGETSVWRCRDCGQHFWKGSHWESVQEALNGMRS